ncbi:hypothetical protein GIB67_009552 [Kingdonia uniflora]|uniref:RNase H type-1 domain-containing protein n=1 Tax=Kingdonia uniflora TaxID=39325 RepID=A0A7J7NW25_9MAGN|nr:hypothetical protein GIB67_009552 [Kingdonia uniflora]
MVFSVSRWLWNARNKIRFDETKLSIREIQNRVLREIANNAKLSKHDMYNTASDLQIIKALSVECKMSKAPVVKSCMWILPNVNEIKLCCDGSALGNPCPSGIEIVYRDWEGRVLGTLCKSVGTTTNYLTEVNAIIDGVEKAIYRGWNNLWVVSDSSAAINAFVTHKIPWKFRTKWTQILNSMQSIRLAQPGDKQTFRQIPWLKEDPAKTYLLRNGLREDRYSLQGLKTPT